MPERILSARASRKLTTEHQIATFDGWKTGTSYATGTKGLRVRWIKSRQAREFVTWHAKPGGGNELIILGTTDDLTLDLAKARLLEVQQERRRSKGSQGPRTVRELVDTYFTNHIEPRNVSAAETRRLLDNQVLPQWGADTRLMEMQPWTLLAPVRAAVERGKHGSARALFTLIKDFWAWGCVKRCVANELAQHELSHCGVRAYTPRSRVLSDEELAEVWAALEGCGEAVKAILRLQMLLGLRTGEIRRGRWGNVDWEAATYTVPGSLRKRSKAGKALAGDFVVPLPEAALAVLRDLQEVTGRSGLLAPGNGPDGLLEPRSVGQAVRTLQGRVNKAMEAQGEPGMAPFTAHDLRRTVSTGLNKHGVQPHVVERCLDHTLGGVMGTYNQYDYLDERRAALELWDRHLITVSAPGTPCFPATQGFLAEQLRRAAGTQGAGE